MSKPQPAKRTFRYLYNRIEFFENKHLNLRGWNRNPDEAARCTALCNADQNGNLAIEEVEKAAYEKEARTNKALFKIVGTMANAFPCMKYRLVQKHRLDYTLSRSLYYKAEANLRKRIVASIAKAQETIADPKASAKDKKVAEEFLERVCDKLDYDEAY